MAQRGKTIQKNCLDCGKEFKPLVSKVKVGKGKYCTLRCFHNSRKSNLDSKQLDKIYQAKFRYGIEKNQYLELMKNTNCKICDKKLPEGKKYIDHCHISGIIRGVLCNHCNTGIGMLQDSVDILQKAIAYLKNSSKG